MAGPDQPHATLMHRLLARLPWGLAEEAERQSRRWVLVCSAGHVRNLWEAGHSRIGGQNTKTLYIKCPDCGRRRWCQIQRNADGADPVTGGLSG